ncbi:tripartite tricarboxylate transporter permease [Nitrincola sp.]|uniref:tripartite tricarboxylate transporter permease n=1 Tax=Nitrincola sp. TaxID=1926584 RepID=UPI003A952BC1
MQVDTTLLLSVLAQLASPDVILMLFVGVLGGIFLGALPGLSATMGIALLIPVTFGMQPVAALVLLSAIYASAVYGGSITAILIHTPGTPASAATAMDGYQMTLRGEGLKALGTSTICSVIGGIVSVVALLLLAPPLAQISLRFSAPEYFLIAIFGLTIIGSLSSGAMAKGLAAGLLGLLISLVGVDVMTAYPRFTFGVGELESGISLIPAMIGLFSISQVMIQAEKLHGAKDLTPAPELVGHLFPSRAEWRRLRGTISRSSIIGVLVGCLPGAGGDVASWVAYNEAKRSSKNPENYGKGEIEGLAAAETANNAVTGGAMIPLLTLGIPGSAATAVMLGGLYIHGLQPGHELFTVNAHIVYAIIVGLLLANILMGIVGLALAKQVVKVASVPFAILAPIIVVLSVVGSYTINNSMFDVYVMVAFGLLGYLMRKTGFSTAAIVLAMILGAMAEIGFRQSLVMSKGNLLGYYFDRPFSLLIMGLILLALVSPLLIRWKRNRALQALQRS